MKGRSPRRRGSLRRVIWPHLPSGSIPAQAGKPISEHGVDRHLRGRSPRRRGSPRRHHDDEAKPGSIPAQAGKPSPCGRSLMGVRVDPRAGGEAGLLLLVFNNTNGRSPRRRGSPNQRKPMRSLQEGSIPAQAGKPSALDRAHACASGRGRSPRRRGSRCVPSSRQTVDPRAGGEAVRVRHACGVDPRAGGEASCLRRRAQAATGRSPRRRGSRVCMSMRTKLGRTPGRSPRRRGSRCRVHVHGARRRVDPRAGGEAAAQIARICGCQGSIPAQAGKPRSRQ